MTSAASTRGLWAISIGLLVFGVVQAPLGFFTIDEVIYLFGADTFLAERSLILQNGFDRFVSEDLNWATLLAVGPSGLTPQYPPGSAVIGALLMPVAGERGLLLLNTLATVGALFVTRALALQLFGGEKLAFFAALLFLFGTFVSEYAFSYWPHMVSVFTVALSLLLFLRALDSDTDALWLAALSGLVLGAGMLFRVDNVLLLPTVAIFTVFLGRHPVRIVLGGALGLALPIAALSLANSAKFGSWNPISYGGLVDVTTFLPFLTIGALAFLAMALLRNLDSRHISIMAAVVAAGIGLLLLTGVSPGANRIASAFGQGFLALIIDATTISDPRGGVVPIEDGTQFFWGLSKKALGQSMPWIALLLALVTLDWSAHRRVIWILLTFFVLWSFPFLVRSWHGGMGSNMRYLMPILPALSVLCAWIIARMMAQIDDKPRLLGVAVFCGWSLSLICLMLGPAGLAGAHQFLPLHVMAATAALALLAGRLAVFVRPVVVLAGIGIGVSMFNALSDTFVSQARRTNNRDLSDLSKGVQGPALIYNIMYRSALLNPDQVIGAPHWTSDGPDESLVAQALDASYRVLMPANMAADFVAAHSGYGLKDDEDGAFDLVRVIRIGG